MGNELSIADISLSSYFMFAELAHIPLDDYTNIKNWLSHLQIQPWWQQTQQALMDQIANQKVNEKVNT